MEPFLFGRDGGVRYGGPQLAGLLLVSLLSPISSALLLFSTAHLYSVGPIAY